MENIYAIRPLNERRYRSLAFFIACLIYFVLTTLLLIELVPVLTDTFFDRQQPDVPASTFVPMPKSIPRQTPAPVKYMPRPAPSSHQSSPTNTHPVQITAPTQPVSEQPATQAPQESPKPAQEKTAVPEQHLSKEVERQSPIVQTTQEEKDQKYSNQSQKQSHEGAPQRRRGLRERFYKNGKVPEQTQTHHTPSKNPGAQLTHGFSEHMQQQQAFEQATSLGNLANEHGAVGAISAQVFHENFAFTFCGNSFSQPLKMHASLIHHHEIQIMITCNRNRKVTRVQFIKPSYEPQINDYIRDLLYAMTSPQLPDMCTTDEVTFPINIEIERIYQTNNIYFRPGRKRR